MNFRRFSRAKRRRQILLQLFLALTLTTTVPSASKKFYRDLHCLIRTKIIFRRILRVRKQQQDFAGGQPILFVLERCCRSWTTQLRTQWPHPACSTLTSNPDHPQKLTSSLNDPDRVCPSTQPPWWRHRQVRLLLLFPSLGSRWRRHTPSLPTASSVRSISSLFYTYWHHHG